MFATQLAGNYSVGWALLAGAIGAMAMLAVIYGGRAMGMTTMDLLRTLGSMMQPRGSNAVVYGIGLMVHLMMGPRSGSYMPDFFTPSIRHPTVPQSASGF